MVTRKAWVIRYAENAVTTSHGYMCARSFLADEYDVQVNDNGVLTVIAHEEHKIVLVLAPGAWMEVRLSNEVVEQIS